MESADEVGSSFALDSISVRSCGYPQQYSSGALRLEFACDFDSSTGHTCDIRDDFTNLSLQSAINYTIRSPNNINDRYLGPRWTTGWSGDSFLYWSRSDSTSPTLTDGQFRTPLLETNRDM
ncbi:unnamed protein product [Rotaria sp. Silwood1]|nr:unnamed protein product [Rotaria sp. Silwood1]CAF3534129.1 unnamed protein product [Rotaria sp. Silwood1]CAF4983918.1 unnamed protein product [Rotaria sp. Silwood1]